MAAWMGLVPKLHASGGKQTLLVISEREEVYLRILLIQGARAGIRFSGTRAKPENWLKRLMERRNKNVAAVALANKYARIARALLAKNRMFRHERTSVRHADVMRCRSANSIRDRGK